MDLEMFQRDHRDELLNGALVPIHGIHPRFGPWEQAAFIPNPLAEAEPELAGRAYRTVAGARAQIAALDATARSLPNPQVFRRPAVLREAQSTSALEGTYAPLGEVLDAQPDDDVSQDMREILNYVTVAETAFAAVQDGRPVDASFLCGLQTMLVQGTRGAGPESGRIRSSQVVIGRHPDEPVANARFIPSPPGQALEASLGDLVTWMWDTDPDIDPVIRAAMAHYQFETLHPLHDGNGRIGRLLIVIQLHAWGLLSEPTLTVSEWFEARRPDYYDHLRRVSTHDDWSGWIGFFADGLATSAARTRDRMLALVTVQDELVARVRDSGMRSHTAVRLVELACRGSAFSVRQAARFLEVTYPRANRLVSDLTVVGVLQERGSRSYDRRFYSPAVFEVIVS